MERGLWERLRRVDPRIWDGLLALALATASVLAYVLPPRNADATGASDLGLTLTLCASLAIAWRRRAPLVVAVIVGAAATVIGFLDDEPPLFVPLAIALYTAAALRERERVWAVLLPIALVSGFASANVASEVERQGYNWMLILAEMVTTSGIPIALGRMTFNRRRRVTRDRELAAREAVAAERARIARELHDVVAHHMSVMVVQAGAARAVGAMDPASAAEALSQIEASGRTGLAEMRRLLEILKAEDGESGRAPQPGLAHLEELLEGMRATGLPVETVVEGDPRPLPAGVDLSAYRIVQEALTNTLRHAGAASARVLLRYTPDALEIEVADDGVGPRTGADAAPGGHGLIGMRERTQLFGGALDAGPRPGGGYVVRARLPSEGEA